MWRMNKLAARLGFFAAALFAAASAFAHGDAVEEMAFGRQGDPHKVTRTIQVQMNDKMRFVPAEITVRQGETVRFVAANKGAVLHEMVLGTPQDLARHAALMKKFPGMEHDEPSMTHVKPGGTGEIVWQFTRPGEFQFACLLPGHFDAGMVGRIVVRPQ
jgi:uncharacterized cupredoxin-like copper-binding protein